MFARLGSWLDGKLNGSARDGLASGRGPASTQGMPFPKKQLVHRLVSAAHRDRQAATFTPNHHREPFSTPLHASERISRWWIMLAVVALLAILAVRATAAPTLVPPVVVSPDSESCEGGVCDDDGANFVDDGRETDEGADGDDSGDRGDLALVPRVVRGSRCATDAMSPRCCACVRPIAVGVVAAAAVRAAGLDDDPAPSWRHRTRAAGLVPWISVRYGRDATWKEVDDPTLGYTNMYDVRATWHLDRLLFDPQEIRIAAIDVSRRREKRRVEMMAIHTYYQWLAAHSGRTELTADLDAMTDGWFSQELAKRQKP
jgi:hypothetical protein